MKEIYERPDIMFEDFSLSVNIAGDCDAINKNPNQEQMCAYITRTGLSVFTSEMNGNCTYVEDDGEYNGICYHVPFDENNLFNS